MPSKTGCIIHDCCNKLEPRPYIECSLCEEASDPGAKANIERYIHTERKQTQNRHRWLLLTLSIVNGGEERNSLVTHLNIHSDCACSKGPGLHRKP